MKVIRLFLKSAGIFIFLLLMAATGLIAANPTYICEIRNDYQVDANTFEFDIYLVRTGTDELEYNSFQAGIKLDAGARNGGTISTTFVPGSYEAMPTPLANKLTFQVAKNCITLTATPGGGAGANPINLIPNTQPGIRLGRYHIVNTVPFGQVQPNLTWTFTVTAGYPTKLNAYVPYPGGIAAEITVQASHVYNLANPFLNKPIVDQVVTGAGGYCAGGAGLVVGLGGSELGVTYTLVKDGTPTAVTVAGTGAAVSFPGFQTEGLYTVTASRNATYITGVMTSSALIVLTPLPAAAGNINGPASVLEGTMGVNYSTAVITNADTYIWAYSGTGVTIIGDGPAVTLDFAMGATDGNLTVAGHNLCGDGIVSAAFPIDVQAGGPTLFNVTGGGSYCQGGVGLPVGLDGSVTAVAYDLYLNGGVVPVMTVIGDGNPIAFGNQLAGTYTVKVGTALMNGSAVIVENPLPVATITPSGPTTFCVGGSVDLMASAGASWLWSNGATTQTITVTAAGLFSVTVTDANNCSATSLVTEVTVNPLPEATITPSGPTTFCAGGSVDLMASAGASWLWSNGATTQTITVNASGLFSVTVTNANNCSATSLVTEVTVNPLPVATITPSGPTTFCVGGSVDLMASAGTSWLWSNGATTQTITVNASGLFSVTVTNANNCSATSLVTEVTVNPLPVATITPSGPTTFCAGGSVDLVASAGASWLWSNGATTQTITVNASGLFSVTVTNANNCSATSLVTEVTVNPLPVATITAGGPTTFCEGGSVELTASAGDSYLWSTGATTQAIMVTMGGSYDVTVTTLGCSDMSDATLVTVNPYPAAAGPIAGNHHVLIGSLGNAYSVGPIANAVSYQWSYSGTGATINGNGTMNVTVDFLPTATEGQLHVMGMNPCGYGVDSFFDIFFDVPSCVTATWNGSVSEDWNNPLNWNGYCVPTATTNVVIPAGLTNYPTLAAAGACNNIMFGSTAAGTATLLDNGFLTIGGTATVQRFYSANDLDWHLVSSPVTAATANVFLAEYLQSFNEASNAYTEIVAPATPLNVMEGYGLYNTVGTSATAVFNGTLNLGMQSHGFTASGLGWNLLGNPFVSSIDWEAVTIPTSMSNEVHYIDAATGADLSYVKGVGGAGSQYIPPMQGFFVSAMGAGTLAVGDAQRSHMGGNMFYKSENPMLVVLEAAGANYSDQAWIHFNDQAGVEHDGVYDAYKRISTSNPLLPQLYSTTPTGVKMSVNGMPQTSTVPVGFTAVQSGNFTITAVQKGEFTKVTLEDLFNGTFTNLLTDSYSFNYTSGDQENRFLLHFNGVSVDENQADLLNIYSIQKDVYVSVPSNKLGNVKILNMLGQEVAQTKIVDVLTKLTVNQIGIYVVQVKLDNGKIYTKKVIIR